MTEFDYTVMSSNGIHARPAGVLVNTAKKYSSDIVVKCNSKKADCKRLFSVMALGAGKGDVITVSVSGNDEEKASAEIKNILESEGL